MASPQLAPSEEKDEEVGESSPLLPEAPKGDDQLLEHEVQEEGRQQLGRDREDVSFLHPQRTTVHMFFVLTSALAVLFLACMALCQLLTAVVFVTSKLEWVQYVLRAYILMFCLLFILAELQVDAFLQWIPVMDNWIYRGFMYTFLGVIGVEESHAAARSASETLSFAGKISIWFVKISSLAMFALGMLYFVMGILCLKGLRNRMQERFQEQSRAMEQIQIP